jgi:restriction endonuclease Mrr
LEQFPEFLSFKAKSKTLSEAEDVQPTATASIETPLESLEAAYEKIRGELKAELLDRWYSVSHWRWFGSFAL